MLDSPGSNWPMTTGLAVVNGVPPASVVALASRLAWSLWCFWKAATFVLTDDGRPSAVDASMTFW